MMTPEERNELINTYAAGYDEVINALDGFPADSLGARPIPGKWSAREIVHHLGDSESFSAARLRKLLIEDNAVIQGYDQDEYASKLRYNERDRAPALDAFRSSRETTGLMSGANQRAKTSVKIAVTIVSATTTPVTPISMPTTRISLASRVPTERLNVRALNTTGFSAMRSTCNGMK